MWYMTHSYALWYRNTAACLDIYIYVYVCVCVCVCERERERERVVCAYACVCVCVCIVCIHAYMYMPAACLRIWQFICDVWLIRMRDMTHSYVRYEAGGADVQRHVWESESWYVTYDLSSYVCHDSFICVSWSRGCRNTAACLGIWELIRDIWLIRMRDMTHSYVCHESGGAEIQRHVWESESWYVTYDLSSYVWHDSFICVSWIRGCRNTAACLGIGHSW